LDCHDRPLSEQCTHPAKKNRKNFWADGVRTPGGSGKAGTPECGAFHLFLQYQHVRASGDWSISDPVLGLSIIAEILIFIEGHTHRPLEIRQ
jgi:hypothetical protein